MSIKLPICIVIAESVSGATENKASTITVFHNESAQYIFLSARQGRKSAVGVDESEVIASGDKEELLYS